ncbi:MAG: 30S ribosomal protein S7 [Pseudomonadota bacterium]
MSRRREAEKRKLTPDSKYQSVLIAKIINHLMLDGKKSTAERIVYGALDLLVERGKTANVVKAEKEKILISRRHSDRAKDEDEGGEDGGTTSYSFKEVELFDLALENVRPSVEVRPRRVGGATYQVPMEVRSERRDALAMRWIIDCARKRNEKGMMERLANELLDALTGKGSAVKKCEDMHKMAKANQAFAHFRWN